MSDQYEFDLTPTEIPYKIGGKDYILREASGEAAVKYSNAKLSRLTLGGDGKPSTVKNMGDVEPYLVSLCLFMSSEEAPTIFNIPVHDATIRSWPQRIQKALFIKAKEISEIDQDETKEALEKLLADTQAKLDKLTQGDAVKNEQSGIEAGSA